MGNRTLKASMHSSDKLYACRDAAPVQLTMGDYAKLLFAWLFVPLQDDWGCFELNIRKIVGVNFWIFEQPPSEEQLTRTAHILNANGLLFVWEQGEKVWGYLTGKEEGRLPALDSRRLRHTPSLHPDSPGIKRTDRTPTADWPEVRAYLANYQQLTPVSDGSLTGFHVPPQCLYSASILPPSSSTRPPSPSVKTPPSPVRPPSCAAQPPPASEQPPPASTSPPLARARAELRTKNLDLRPIRSFLRKEVGGRKRGKAKQPGEEKTGAIIKKNLKNLAKTKTLQAAGRDGDLRKHMAAGIFRKKVLNCFDDFHLSRERGGTHDFGEIVYAMTQEAAKSLLSNRGAVELRGLETDTLVKKAWQQILPHIPRFQALQDYQTRKLQIASAVINQVLDVAMNLARKKNGNYILDSRK